MNRKWKKALKTAFAAPEPKRKKEFLLSVNFPRATRFDFMIGQIGYIRKRVWVISCLLVIAALLGIHLQTNNVLNVAWIVSSVLPFISLVIIMEITRSTSFHMAELEMSCKYNFSDIVLVRLGILGGFNMTVFGLILISFLGKVNFNIFRLGMYLFAPFLLTCSLSLFTLNCLRSRETTYICGSISCFISIVNTLISIWYDMVFSDRYLWFWSMAFIILLVWTAREIIRLIKKMEELQWNWSSIA